MSADAAPPVLRLAGITKRFGPLLANDAISLELQRGEVLALLGENGAGKSTLMAILFGHYRADAGTVAVDGQPLPSGQPRAALAAGIGMVHQHFTLADNLSVLDNVMLGNEPLWRPWSRRRDARARLLQTAQRFGLGVDPDARVGALSVGERQRVEILKALSSSGRHGPTRVLILDEPTAVLTPQESESLFATLRQMVAAGLSIVFISHKLDEVLRVAHRIAVLRAGRLVAAVPADGASKPMLAELMVGRAVAPVQRAARVTDAAAEPACALLNLRIAERERLRLEVPELVLQPGEILAVAGVSGNGQTLLAELLFGQWPHSAGLLRVAGAPVAARPRAFLAAGVARVPEDRQAVGAIGDLALWENAVLERCRSRSFSRFGWLKRRAAMAHAATLVQGFDVRGTEAHDVRTRTRQLSGGNLQKLILGRALVGDPAASRPPVLIVAAQPTWGLDVGAVAAVHQRLVDACAAGAAVLLISEDLDEIFALADRIAVMHRGRLGAAWPAAQWSWAGIGLAMAGHAESGDAA